jgi:hypothetical protein
MSQFFKAFTSVSVPKICIVLSPSYSKRCTAIYDILQWQLRCVCVCVPGYNKMHDTFYGPNYFLCLNNSSLIFDKCLSFCQRKVSRKLSHTKRNLGLSCIRLPLGAQIFSSFIVVWVAKYECLDVTENPVLCPLHVFVCFTQLLHWQPFLSQHNVKRLVFVTGTRCERFGKIILLWFHNNLDLQLNSET